MNDGHRVGTRGVDGRPGLRDRHLPTRDRDNGTEAGDAARARVSDAATPLEGPAEGHLVGVLEVAADRQP